MIGSVVDKLLAISPFHTMNRNSTVPEMGKNMAKRRSPFIFSDMPVGLKPIYPMAAVNQPIELYKGKLELEQNAKTLSGEGVVQFEWLPRPQLRFSLDLPMLNSHPPALEEGILHLLGINWHAKVTVLGYSASSDKGVHDIRGLIDNFEIGQAQSVTSIIFHVVNFNDYSGHAVCNQNGSTSWASRSVIEVGEWRIFLDKIEESKRIFDELKSIGGFAITHVGKIVRLDGQKFAATKSDKVFETLFRYLSFCRGAWVAPILAVGFDENDNRVWEKWRSWKIERWRTVDNWFNNRSEEGLSKGFPGFYQRWQDEKWRESLLLSNHWYVEANMSAGGMEGSIILAQAAFELLGWTLLVEERLALSEKGYEDLRAMDKLRLLLSICQIPANIPPSLTTINTTAKVKGNEWKDGPQALTEVRNALVHSNPAKRRKLLAEPGTLVYESWKLSLWYLELIMLNIFKYNEKYSSRVAAAHWIGDEVETVPWV